MMKIEAGLPNIVCTFPADFKNEDDDMLRNFTGCLRYLRLVPGGYSMGGSDDHLFEFNAALASQVYGRSTTVQPASVTVNYLIKAR